MSKFEPGLLEKAIKLSSIVEHALYIVPFVAFIDYIGGSGVVPVSAVVAAITVAIFLRGANILGVGVSLYQNFGRGEDTLAIMLVAAFLGSIAGTTPLVVYIIVGEGAISLISASIVSVAAMKRFSEYEIEYNDEIYVKG